MPVPANSDESICDIPVREDPEQQADHIQSTDEVVQCGLGLLQTLLKEHVLDLQVEGWAEVSGSEKEVLQKGNRMISMHKSQIGLGS